MAAMMAPVGAAAAAAVAAPPSQAASLCAAPLRLATAARCPAPQLHLAVRCGRGDMRTAKGKRTRGSFGNSRPKARNGRAKLGLPPTPLPPRPPKKDEADSNEYIPVDIDESMLTN
eukprot:SM000142S00550  [mRNA]  locus=s142:234189:235152:- [translate_table: standard]